MYSIGRKLDKMIKSDVIDDDEATDILKALQSLPMTLEMLKVNNRKCLFKNCLTFPLFCIDASRSIRNI